MPKPGYKTITISEKVYNKFLEFSKKNQVAGVNSFSGYVTYLLESKMAKDKTFAKYAPKLELISIEEDRVIIKNKIENRIAEIVYQEMNFTANFVRQRIVIVLDMLGQFLKSMKN